MLNINKHSVKYSTIINKRVQNKSKVREGYTKYMTEHTGIESNMVKVI